MKRFLSNNKYCLSMLTKCANNFIGLSLMMGVILLVELGEIERLELVLESHLSATTPINK
jgi:hypothetical protein